MRQSLIGTLLIGLTAFFTTGETATAQKNGKKDDKTQAIKAEEVKLGRPVDFKKDVLPILEKNCVACHNVAIDESKLSLEDVKSIRKGGKRGPAVVPKNPEKSLLFQVASRAKKPAMPPMPNKVDARTLTPREVGMIRQWILEGAGAGSGSQSSTISWTPLPPTLNPIYSVALSPWARFAAAGRANQIHVYNLISKQEEARLVDPALSSVQYEGAPMYPRGAAHRDFVHSLAFSPDGNLIASGGFRNVKLWKRVPGPKAYEVSLGDAATAVAVSPDGKRAALGSADGNILLVDAATGKTGHKLTGHSGPVTGLAFSADGKQLVSSSADKTLRIWDVLNGKEVRAITSPAAGNDVAFNKDGSQILSADADNVIRVWKTTKDEKAEKDKDEKDQQEKPVVEMKGHSKPVTSLDLILPAGSQVVSGSEDGTVQIWTISNGKAGRAMNLGAPVTDVAASPDGKAVAAVSPNGTGKLWEAGNGKQIAELKGRLSRQQQLARLMEEQEVEKQRLADAQSDVKTAEKNLKDREESLKKAKEAKTKADKALAEAEKKAKPFNDKIAAAKAELKKKPDDKGLKKKLDDAEKAGKKANDELQKAKNTAEAAARALKLGETSVKRAKDRLDEKQKLQSAAEARKKKADADLKAAQDADKSDAEPFTAVAFSADGQTVATGTESGRVRLWGGSDGQPLAVLDVHQSALADVAFGPNGLLLCGAKDKKLTAIGAGSSWKLVGRIGTDSENPLDLSGSPFVGRVLSLEFSRDGKMLATGGGDPSRSGELMIWDVENRKLIREFPDAHSDTILDLQFNWDGTKILTGSADKFAKIFDVQTGKHVRSFEGHTHHVLGVAWQADGRTVATAGADNVIKVWNAKTSEQKRTISGYSKQVTSVQFIGVGANIVACSGDQRVRFHRTNNGQAYRNFNGGDDFMYASAAARSAAAVVSSVGSEATVVVAGGEDGVLRVWDGRAQLLKAFEPPKPPATGKTQANLNGQAGK